MTTCVVFTIDEHKPINIIEAELTDLPPDGCYLGLMPEGYYWDGKELVKNGESI